MKRSYIVGINDFCRDRSCFRHLMTDIKISRPSEVKFNSASFCDRLQIKVGLTAEDDI